MVTHFEVDDLHASRLHLVQLCLEKFLMLLMTLNIEAAHLLPVI